MCVVAATLLGTVVRRINYEYGSMGGSEREHHVSRNRSSCPRIVLCGYDHIVRKQLNDDEHSAVPSRVPGTPIWMMSPTLMAAELDTL